MPLPLFFPAVRYKPSIAEDGRVSLEAICDEAGVHCGAVGAWTQRAVRIVEGGEKGWILAEPGSWGTVEIGVPQSDWATSRRRARWALGAMAYMLFDGVARASIAGQQWVRVAVPPGRAPSEGLALSNAERQRRHRARWKLE
jgi:hypothetical protein